MFQAKAALRNERLAKESQQKKKSKKSTKATKSSIAKSKSNNSNKSSTTTSKKPSKNNSNTRQTKSSHAITIVDSSDESESTDSSSSSYSTSNSNNSACSSESSTSDSSKSDSSNHSSHKKSKRKKKKGIKKASSTNYYQPIQDDKQNKRRISKAERRSTKKIQRKYRTFFTLKIRINNNEDSVKELFSQTKKWFDKLQQVDKRGIVYAYQDKDPSSALMNSSDLPDDYAVYKNFFQGTRTQEEAGWTWATIWLGHDVPVESLIDSMSKWSRKTMTWMFVEHLQEKDTVKEYFFIMVNEYFRYYCSPQSSYGYHQ